MAVWERAQKRANGSCLDSGVLSMRYCSLALALMPDTSVSLCMSLVLFKLFP